MIGEISILLLSLANLIIAVGIFRSLKPKIEPQNQQLKPKTKKLRRKIKKNAEMTKEDKLLYNLEVFDGTSNGQMDI